VTRVLLLALLMLPACALALAEDEAQFPWEVWGMARSDNPACIPTPRGDWWPAYHTNMLAREPREDARVIFLGDSITMMWRTQSGFEGGTEAWEQYYAPLHAANLGISGDRTEHILWRITAGHNLDGANPEVLVLQIGINNCLQRTDSPEQVAEGIGRIVEYLRGRLPETRILLLGLFPCGEQPDNPSRAWVRETNVLIAPLADGERVWFADISDAFVEPDGTISREKLRDLLHLSLKGYFIWAETMQPYLDDLLEGDGIGAVWQGAP